jgi:predicted metal-dependent RNase
LPETDYVVCETTYGARLHEDKISPEDALAKVIQRACIDLPGRLIIPAFSVGRTQALLTRSISFIPNEVSSLSKYLVIHLWRMLVQRFIRRMFVS